jgi:hypothetical protein
MNGIRNAGKILDLEHGRPTERPGNNIKRFLKMGNEDRVRWWDSVNMVKNLLILLFVASAKKNKRFDPYIGQYVYKTETL